MVPVQTPPHVAAVRGKDHKRLPSSRFALQREVTELRREYEILAPLADQIYEELLSAKELADPEEMDWTEDTETDGRNRGPGLALEDVMFEAWSRIVVVQNLDPRMSPEEVYTIFANCGPIASVKMLQQASRGTASDSTRTFAVEFRDERSRDVALWMDGIARDGRQISVKWLPEAEAETRESFQELAAVKVEEPGVVKVEDTGVVKVEKPGAVKVEETGVVKVEEPGVVKVEETAAVKVEEPVAVKVEELE